jgi:glycosyltransferase involved in cell wall biosynthesis
VAAKIAKQLKLPLFVSVLGTDVNRLKENTFLSHRALEVVEYASQIKCVSGPLKNKLVSVGCNQNKLFVLQNGIDKKIFHPIDKNLMRSELGISIHDKVILFVGNLKKEKGLGELCHAFSQLRKNHLLSDCRLVVIGAGGFRSTMEQLLAELNISDKTDILGERPLEVIAKYMNASDVLCLPSYSEGQPNVVMEALACHTRVVATNVGGTPDLDLGYGNIKLISPANVSELTIALLEVITDGMDCERWYPFNSWADNAAHLHELFESLIMSEV